MSIDWNEVKPQRFRWVSLGYSRWKHGVCLWNLTHEVWEVHTFGLLPMEFYDGFADTMSAIIGPVSRFEWIDSDFGWEPVERPPVALRGDEIAKTGHHDAGAIAQCSYCRRYSDNPKALDYNPRGPDLATDVRCDCGKTRGWCGSFKKPTAESVWSK